MSETSPAITIGIMTHNYGRYIQEAIESVLAQGRTDWELIISDDASTDDTTEIVTPYLADPRIRYVRHETNLGQAGNWGYLLGQGTASILAVLHADDAWLPSALETALAAFEAEPELDLFYGNWVRRSNNLQDTLANKNAPHVCSGHDEFRHQCRCFTCLASAAFVSRRVVNLIEPPDATLKMVVDYEYFLRVCAAARRVQSVTEPLTMYRIHRASTTAESTANGVFLQERERLPKLCEQRLKAYPNLLPSLSVLRTQMATSIFEEGVSKSVQGDTPADRVLMKKGFRLFPTLAINPKFIAQYLLASMGDKGRSILCLLHKNRMRTEIEAA